VLARLGIFSSRYASHKYSTVGPVGFSVWDTARHALAFVGN
jgi:hypothetical protein